MARPSRPYQDLIIIQNELKKRVLNGSDDKACALLAREWVGAEAMKRVMRGCPVMKPMTIAELRSLRAPKQIHDAIEAEVVKESLSSQTVTAPPATEAPE